MRILLINVPHSAIGSRIPDDHLPPFGLLCVGGPVIDDGHEVKLIDAEFGQMALKNIISLAVMYNPDAVLFGHSGSTSAHPTIAKVSQAIKAALSDIKIIYGGVYPTYHWRDILLSEPHVDVIVRGEGEETTRKVIRAFENNLALDLIPGIAFRKGGQIRGTSPAPVIRDPDAYRIGWELIDFRKYSYWGGRRAVVMQFSRGCPHPCNYCGQRGFWSKWRHRDPVKFAKELAWLHREHGVKLINLADENPTSSRKRWLEFLEALIAEDINLTIVGSTRADDIVRDADILHLYKKAGIIRFLLGMENTDEATLQKIKKGGSTTKDREAINLLRQHGIVSMMTYVVGFEEETDKDYWRGLRQILSYDPDQIQMLYVTPHRWTPYFHLVTERRVIQTELKKWDYKHQVLSTRYMNPWRVMLWVKSIEAIVQLRPKAIWRNLAHPDPEVRYAMRWYTKMGRRVWPHEIFNFLFQDKKLKNGPTVAEFFGMPEDTDEKSMQT